ncbi:WD and tetratricopeptide repeats protein 1 [Zea mays]|uniref:WD and tetratricopeptide repeats protein 1 n=1 Tax=Zea mays TaxID=4577 RepID=A0A3L6DD54_MAIZE|nr:WD and tetratricopeptide repeats protein 1 [Zea mays]
MLVVKNSNSPGHLNEANCVIFMKNVGVERMEMGCFWSVALLGARSIVLDPANPSVKSQAKSMAAAAVEGNPRRMHWKQKSEFLKKNKAAVITPTKSVLKVKLSNNIPKGNISSSPAPSPEQPGESNPSFPVGSDANNEVITPFDFNKEENSKYEKPVRNKMSNKDINRRASSHAANVDDNTNEVRSYLISVLSKNPKGMGLKALEKAVADAFPNASKKIQSIIKNIANYQGPERYVLKSGLEVESSKSHVSEGVRSISKNIEESAPSLTIDDPDICERIDIVGSLVAPTDGKLSNDSEAVDITSDDDKANIAHTKVVDDLNLSSSPRDLKRLDVDDEQIDIETNLDYRSTSPHIGLNKFNTGNDDAAAEGFSAGNLSKPSEMSGSKNMTSTRMVSIGVDTKYNEMSFLDNLFDDSMRIASENSPKGEAGQLTVQHVNKRKSTSKDESKFGPVSIAKPKLKRSSGSENSTAKPESAKKVKADIASSIGSLSEHKRSLPPEKYSNDRFNKGTWDVSRDASQDSSPAMKGRPLAPGNLQRIDQSPNLPVPTMHSERTKENTVKSSLKKKSDKSQKPWHGMDGDFGPGYSHGVDHHTNFDGSDDFSTRKRSRHGNLLIDDKMFKRSKDANANVDSMNLTKSSRETVVPDEITAFPESNECNGEQSNSQRDNVERSPYGKKKLQRELSDLELAELRETSLENDDGRIRKQFESSSSKSLDAKLNVINSYPSMNDRKVPVTVFNDTKRKPSPQEYGIGGHINQEGFPRKAAGYEFDDNRPQQNIPDSQHLPRIYNTDFENLIYPDSSGKTSKRETRMTHGGMLEYADIQKKKSTSRLPQNGTNNVRVSRMQKSISPSDNDERSRNDSLIETKAGRKRRGSSSDDDNLFFSKYDKDAPELKDPIKDFSQYKDYVQEYNEKYGVYSYLNSQIDKTMSEFLKIQDDLNVGKERGKEQYYNTLERLRDMYHESGTRHKLMKKVFVLLHEELQRDEFDSNHGEVESKTVQISMASLGTCAVPHRRAEEMIHYSGKRPQAFATDRRVPKGAVSRIIPHPVRGDRAEAGDAGEREAARDIKKKVQFHSSLVQKLALEKEMEGHVGCVNAIAWNSSGSLLVSGSDDTRDIVSWILSLKGGIVINIWNYNNRELVHDIDTGHSANIFCTKFVPETCDEVVVSGAGDAEVRVFNMSRLSGRRPREISMEPTAVYQCHSRRVKKLAVEVGNPNAVWSASEDGTLRQHDFRECSSCPRAGSANQECRNVLLDLRCGAKKSLADLPKHPLALKSCDISSVCSHQILVGGSDAFARLYDRRMLPPLSSCQTKRKPPPCVKMFCPLHLADSKKTYSHLTHVAFSPNGKEVLLSYSGEHVYLFDVDPDGMSSRYTADYVDMCKKFMQVATRSLETGIIEFDLQRKWKNDVYMAIRDCNRTWKIDVTSYQAHLHMAEALLQLGRLKEASEHAEVANGLLPPHCPLREQVDDFKQRIASAELEKNRADQNGSSKADTHGKLRSLSEILFRPDVGGSSQEGREDSDYDDETEMDYETTVSGHESRENDQGVFRGSLSFQFHQREDQTNVHTDENGSVESPRKDDYAFQSDVAIDMKQRYVAHCNVGTDIKQASFLGEQGEFIASGSDDGRWFIWEKRTGRLIKMLAGDGAVVNCIQSHPFDCAVATSGIDNTIKLWTPDANATSMVSGPELDVLSAIENNQQKLCRNRHFVLPSEFLERFQMHEFSEGFECAQS